MAHRILVVDDDPSARAFLKKILESAGYDTVLASTFQDGKRLLASDAPPDLLIADLRLGEFNGLQLHITSRKRVQAIIVSGYPDPVLAQDSRNLGAAFLGKPFSAAALLALVREKLEKASDVVAFATSRRWARKVIVGNLQARVQQSPARILDISYGGLRLEVERREGRDIPPTFNVTLPTSDLSVQVDLVWKSQMGDQSWLCGATVSDTNQAATRAWHGLVDALA